MTPLPKNRIILSVIKNREGNEGFTFKEGRGTYIGQYWRICCLDKKQYLDPHCFGEGAKAQEFAFSSCGVMTALALLLMDSDGCGGGDFPVKSELIGSWAGHKVVITGDYDTNGKWYASKDGNLYSYSEEHFDNISNKMLKIMLKDPSVNKALKEAAKTNTHLFSEIDKANAETIVVEKKVIKEEKVKPGKAITAPEVAIQYEGMQL